MIEPLLDAMRFRCIGPPRGGRVVAVAGDPSEPAVFWFGAVAGGVWEDRGCRRHLEERERRVPEDLVGGRTRGVGLRARRDLGRHGREHHPRRRLPRRRRVPIRRRGPHLVAPRPRRHPPRQRDPRSPARPRPRPGWPRSGTPSAPIPSAACSAPPTGSELGAGAVPGRPLRGGRPRARYPQSHGPLRQPLAGAPQLLGALERRPRKRPVALDRRRNYLDRDYREPWPPRVDHARQDRGDRVAGPLRTRVGAGRSGRGARTVPLRRLRRDLGARERPPGSPLPSLVLHARARRPAERGYCLRQQSPDVEVDRRRRALHAGPHSARRQPRTVDRPARQPAHDPGQRRRGQRLVQCRRLVEHRLQPAHRAALHVETDGRAPHYFVYGTQQDNSSIGVPSGTNDGAIAWEDCRIAGTGESGYVAVDPKDPTSSTSAPSAAPRAAAAPCSATTTAPARCGTSTCGPSTTADWDRASSSTASGGTFPIRFSPHDANVLYAGGNRLFRSTDEGQSWKPISPDLTRADPDKLGPSGGPITRDTSGAEHYCCLYAFAESPHEPGVLWTGSDDGLVHLSRDGGQSWRNVTPPSLPEWAFVRTVEPSPHDPATLYLAATRYKLDDNAPYLFKTADYGESWQSITGESGDGAIPGDDFVRVIRADPGCPGLLYAGTETGLYVSLDDGARWRRWRSNFPVTPVYDLKIEGTDLVVATHGTLVLDRGRPDAAAPRRGGRRRAGRAACTPARLAPAAGRHGFHHRLGRQGLQHRPRPAGHLRLDAGRVRSGTADVPRCGRGRSGRCNRLLPSWRRAWPRAERTPPRTPRPRPARPPPVTTRGRPSPSRSTTPAAPSSGSSARSPPATTT